MTLSYYDEIANGYEELHREEQLRKARIVLENIRISKTTKLLDVGCGSGISSGLFDCERTGLDSSAALLEIARKKIPDMRFVHGCAENLPFQDNSFDVVVCLTALHNFDNPEKGLLEMKRVGKGLFAISVLKKSPKAERLQLLIEKHFKVERIIDEGTDIIIIAR